MPADTYLVPDLPDGLVHRVEQTIKRSRFIASVAHTDGVDEAKAFVERIKAEFSDARHNCWAFCAGAPGHLGQLGASDDGEPHGTAGRPMLAVVSNCGVGEITVVVTRYFGGILLGTGGLVKAYQGSVKLALDSLPTTEMMIASYLRLTIEHRYVAQLRNILPRYRATIRKQEFDFDATLEIKIPSSEIPEFSRYVTNLTADGVLIEELPDKQS